MSIHELSLMNNRENIVNMKGAHHYNRYRLYNNAGRELTTISFCIDVVQQTLPHRARLGAATLFFPFYFGL